MSSARVWKVDPNDASAIPAPDCGSCTHANDQGACLQDLESCVNIPCGCAADLQADYMSSMSGLMSGTTKVVRYRADTKQSHVARVNGKGRRSSRTSRRKDKKALSIDPNRLVPSPPLPPLTEDTIPVPTPVFDDNDDSAPHRPHNSSAHRSGDLAVPYRQRVITREQVALHNTAQDCWVIVDRYVLDLSNFLQFHPGGGKSIVNVAGQDATEHLKFHSAVGRRLFRKYRIGIVADKHPGCVIL